MVVERAMAVAAMAWAGVGMAGVVAMKVVVARGKEVGERGEVAAARARVEETEGH